MAQARLGVRREEHEQFFRQMLGDVEEWTAPFGLTDVQGDGAESNGSAASGGQRAGERLRQQARQLGVSAASLCHVAWAQVLARSVRARGCGVRHGAVRSDAGGRGCGPGAGDVHQHAAGADSDWRRERQQTAFEHTHELLTELLRHEHASLALAQRCSGVVAPAPLFTALLNYRHIGAGRERERRPNGRGKGSSSWAERSARTIR